MQKSFKWIQRSCRRRRWPRRLWHSGSDLSAPRAATGGRKVTAKFMAKAPGVSPIRVALMNANGEGADGAPPDGKGIVRVR